MTLLQKLDRIPPFLCIAIATGRKDFLTIAQVSAYSSVPLRTIERISTRMSWGKVNLETAHRVTNACGINLLHPGKSLRYLKNTIQSKSPLPMLGAVQRRAFNRRFTEWRQSLKPASPAPAPAPVKR